MAIFFASSLSGPAQAILTDLDGDSRREYYALIGAVSLRFRTGAKKELLRSQLRNRVRGKEETLPELAQAIQRQIRQAYPDAPLSVLEVLEKNCFLDAIPNTHI